MWRQRNSQVESENVLLRESERVAHDQSQAIRLNLEIMNTQLQGYSSSCPTLDEMPPRITAACGAADAIFSAMMLLLQIMSLNLTGRSYTVPLLFISARDDASACL